MCSGCFMKLCPPPSWCPRGRVVLQATPIMGSPAAPSLPGPCALVGTDWPWTGDLPSSGGGEQGRREGTDADRRDCLAQGPVSCNRPRNGFVNLLGVVETRGLLYVLGQSVLAVERVGYGGVRDNVPSVRGAGGGGCRAPVGAHWAARPAVTTPAVSLAQNCGNNGGPTWGSGGMRGGRGRAERSQNGASSLQGQVGCDGPLRRRSL